jgi:hypothetical protein
MGGTLQKRIPRRRRVLLSATLESDEGQQEARIRDISIKGALLEVADPPREGSEIALSCGDTAITGKVAWLDGALVGIEFTLPLKGSLLADAEGNRLQVSAPKSYRRDRPPPAEAPVRTGDRVIKLRDSPNKG